MSQSIYKLCAAQLFRSEKIEIVSETTAPHETYLALQIPICCCCCYFTRSLRMPNNISNQTAPDTQKCEWNRVSEQGKGMHSSILDTQEIGAHKLIVQF